MTIEDLDDVYCLEVKSYQFPWTREILRDCILYNYDSYSNNKNHMLEGAYN